MLKSANLGLNIFEGPDNVRRINFVENFELLDKTYGELVKNNSEYVRTTGNANTYLVSKDGLTSYYEGLCLKIKIHVDSTNNCTLNVNNLGAKYIRDSYGNIVKNLKKNIPYHVCYNGSDFILLGKGGGGNATSDKILSGYTATVDGGPITGTMPNQGVKIYTPGRYNIAIPEGYHNGQGYIKGEPNLISENIAGGVTLFGITGKCNNSNYFVAWNNQAFRICGSIEITGLMPKRYIIISLDNSYRRSEAYMYDVSIGAINSFTYRYSDSDRNGRRMDWTYSITELNGRYFLNILTAVSNETSIAGENWYPSGAKFIFF